MYAIEVGVPRPAAPVFLQCERRNDFSGWTAGRSLDALISGRVHAADLAARIAGLPPDSRFAVIVHRADTLPDELPSLVGGVRVLWRRRMESVIGVAVLDAADVSVVVGAMSAWRRGKTGVSPVLQGVERLPLGWRLAELAVRTVVRDHGVACLEQRWATTLLTSCPRVASELSWDVLAPLLTLDQESRDVLLDTFIVWVAADGSARDAAPALYCHRNTVLNRLRRLEKLTERSLSTPKDLVELSLAIHGIRLRSSRKDL